MKHFTPSAKDFEQDLKRGSIPPRIVLGKCQGLDPGLRESPLFQDSMHLPFYYYLGRRLPRTSVVNFGFGIGLPLAMYLTASPGKALGQHGMTEGYYHPRLGVGNVKRVSGVRPKTYHGDMTDPDFISLLSAQKWGAALVCDPSGYDRTVMTLQLAWEYLTDDGYVVVGRLEDKKVTTAFESFCTIVSRRGIKINTRTGHGLVFRS